MRGDPRVGSTPTAGNLPASSPDSYLSLTKGCEQLAITVTLKSLLLYNLKIESLPIFSGQDHDIVGLVGGSIVIIN